MQEPISSYRGDEPYIFVSYSHADDQTVFSEIRWLTDNGFHVWYDEGISVGSRWTEDIAQRIRGAALVLYFVTRNSAGSENCANEIDYALDNRAQVISVHLKPTKLPEGQKLALGGRQMIMRHQMSKQVYREKLLESISTQFGREVPEIDFRGPVSPLVRPVVIVVAAVLLVVSVLGLWYGLSVPRSAEETSTGPREPIPVLIADFDNRTDVALFDGTVEGALAIGLEDAPFITSYPRTDARKKLTSLGPDYELDEEGTRLIAVRENLKLVLVGEITSDGDGYELIVRVIEPVSGVERVEVSAEADNQLEVLEAVASLARQVRTRLGDVTVGQSALDETMSARSLEAVAYYSKAQALAADWKHAEAVVEYERAVAIDDQLGRAYGGWAYSALQLDQTERALELWDRMMTLLHTMTQREQLSAMGMYYANAVHNNEKAKEVFVELVAKYPADARGANNLAVMHFLDRDFDKAIEVQVGLLKIYSKRALYRGNFALFYMYAGDFESAGREAEQVLALNPDYYVAYLPRAAAGLVSRNYQDAGAAYDDMAAIGGNASYLADIGRVDLALARGDYQSGMGMLRTLINEGGSRSLVRERIWLAWALLRSGDETGAIETIDAIDESTLRDDELLQLGEAHVALDQLDAASEIAAKLRARLRDVPRAYADLLGGQVALGRADHAVAIDLLSDALGRADMWLAHFVRGRVYLDAGLLPEAMQEFALCLERNGEGIAVFLDDIPTYHRLVEVRYWHGRALEGIGQIEPAARAYQDYVAARDLAATDPLVQDARRRMSDLLSR